MSDVGRLQQFLSIGDYAASERSNSSKLGNLEIAAFGPVVFNQLSFPHSVSEEQEIVRYVDSMHEDEASKYFSADYRISEVELELIEKIQTSVRELTEAQFGRPVAPVIAPLGALKMFRAVSEISRLHGNKKLKIVEFGPGSGYLGMLLRLSGHQYVSIDIAQAMYLWQNRLYCQMFGDDFDELALNGSSVEALNKPLAHIPWWRLHEIYEKPFADTDIIVADRVVSEMSQNAFLFNSAVAHKLLRAETSSSSTVPKMILFDSFGYKKNRPPESVLADFDKMGFSTVIHRHLWGLAPKDSPLGRIGLPCETVLGRSLRHKLARWRWRNTHRKNFQELTLDGPVPLYDPKKTGKSVLVRDHFSIHENELPLDFGFLAAIGVPYPGAVKRAS